MSFNFYYIRTDDFSAHAGGGQEAVITRDNYEAYFVMYVDDELNATQRQAVEQFIQENPDLEEEMVMLQQSVLRPNEQIVFEHKELLLKGAAAHSPINEQNCEEYFVLYGDDELTNAEKEKVEQFVYHHPQYQAEFELIQQIKLMPDNSLSFPGKAYLYRTEEEDNRIIAFPWWRFTAAAIALLVIGSLTWYIANNAGQQEVAGYKPSLEKTNGNKTIPQVTPPNNNEITKTTTDIEVAKTETPALVNTTTDTKQLVEIIATVNNKKNISAASNKQTPPYVQQVSKETPVQDPEKTDIAITPKPVDVTVDNTYEVIAVKSGIIKTNINEPLAVHTAAAKIKDEDEPDQSSIYVLNAPINKTPLRGFFRKVSRVVDKVTNPEENGKRGIRIANLEIAVN